jgi:hypothetical protein
MRCFRHYEPTLTELMSDDLLGLILARQGLSPGRFERMMLDMADRLLAAPEARCSCFDARKCNEKKA